MDWGGPEFVIAIIAIGTLGSLGRSLIAARHGQPVSGRWHARGGRHTREQAADMSGDIAETARLRSENAELKAHLAKIEDRTRVLERIVTDGGYAVAQQIEALRDSGRDPVSGQKERA